MFKLAIDAGHCLKTAGKRVDKKLDPNQTREWTLNDRVARYIAEAAGQYDGVEILRVDDPTGKKEISLSARCKAANNWGADMYISCHHNAGILLGTGGGITAYCYREGTQAAALRDAVYAACIAAGGLKGNRSNPMPEKGLYVLKNTKAPAVLMEFGFMDSRTDVPVILSEGYPKAMGYAVMEAIAEAHGLKKKADKPVENTCTVEVEILKKGAKGSAVKALQVLLIGYGHSCGSSGVDGSFGAATQKALTAYQKAVGLTPDGSCGPKTWGKLLGAA